MSEQTWEEWCAETAPVTVAAGRGEVVQVQRQDGSWIDRVREGGFCYGLKYRIKPRTIRIGEYDVPDPIREALEVGDKYWVAKIDSDSPQEWEWDGDDWDKKWLAKGIVHLTEEDAQLHSKALISLTEKND